MAHTWLPIKYISTYAFAAILEKIREEIREDLELFWKQKPFNKAPKTRVLVPLAWFGFVHKALPLSYARIGVGRGWGKSVSTCLQNGVCFVKPEATIVKASFRSFCSIFDQNTLLKTLQTCMQGVILFLL